MSLSEQPASHPQRLPLAVPTVESEIDPDTAALFDFDSLFEDHSTPFDSFVNYFCLLDSVCSLLSLCRNILFYHPYNDIHTIKV